MTRIGYARVSSSSQSHEEQERQLRAAGCEVVRCEKQSGRSAADREELQRVLEFLRPGDQLVATRLDRVGRSVADLATIARDLRERGIELVFLHQSVDTSTASGRMFFSVLAAVAEYELELRRERQAEGIAAARRERRSLGGRKKTIDREGLRALLAAEPTIAMAEAARRLRISPASVYRILDELSAAGAPPAVARSFTPSARTAENPTGETTP